MIEFGRGDLERALLYLRARLLAERLASVPEGPAAEVISLSAWRACRRRNGGQCGIGAKFLDQGQDLGD